MVPIRMEPFSQHLDLRNFINLRFGTTEQNIGKQNIDLKK